MLQTPAVLAAERALREAREEAAEVAAMRVLIEAEAVASEAGVSEARVQQLAQARHHVTDPSPRGVAFALSSVSASLANMYQDYQDDPPQVAVKAVQKAERAVRDVVVHRCCRSAEPGDREAFLDEAEKAFGDEWGLPLHSQLLVAYQKVMGPARRVRPRPRRSQFADGEE